MKKDLCQLIQMPEKKNTDNYIYFKLVNFKEEQDTKLSDNIKRIVQQGRRRKEKEGEEKKEVTHTERRR